MTDDKEDGKKFFFSEKSPDVKSAEAVKFIPDNDTKNGLSPINIDTVKTVFTGLTKEELMKYVNDPFWVRIRWSLFILFWLVWLIMLFGAIFIIVITPKCQEPSPLPWWQSSPLYMLDIEKLVPENSLNESSVIGILKNKIGYLKELGIESVLLKSVLNLNGSYDEVLNFTNVNLSLESLSAFHNEIINYAKSIGINIILSFTPNYSGKNEMFIRSSLREDGFKDFYVWYDANYSSKPEKLPNNWLSVYDTPAWEWDDHRKQFYLHQFNKTQPDFNFRNPTVVNFISDVLKFWLNMDISGFHLDKTEYLMESSKFEDENVGRDASYNLKQYGFYTHSQTYELPENVVILNEWSKIIKNNSGILSVSGGILDNRNIADFVLRPLLLSPNFSATEIKEKILHWKEAVNYPTWEWGCSQLNTKCIPESAVDGLIIISFLLPGIPILKFGQECGTNGSNLADQFSEKNLQMYNKSSASNGSCYNLIKKLIEMRAFPAFSFGDFESKVLNETIYAFIRTKTGRPGFLVAWNVGKTSTTVNFQKYFTVIPEDLIIAVKSDSLYKDLYNVKDRVSSTKIEIPSLAAIVFSFVPSLK